MTWAVVAFYIHAWHAGKCQGPGQECWLNIPGRSELEFKENWGRVHTDTDNLRHFGSLRASKLNCCVNTVYKINLSLWNFLLRLLLYLETGWNGNSCLFYYWENYLWGFASFFVGFWVFSCVWINSVNLFAPYDNFVWVLQISWISSETASIHLFRRYKMSFGLVFSKEQCSSFLRFSLLLICKTLSCIPLLSSWLWFVKVHRLKTFSISSALGKTSAGVFPTILWLATWM